MAGVWIRRPPVQEPIGFSFECPVCLETFNETADADVPKTATTSCGHQMCRSCLEKCLQTSMTCPLCRSSLMNERTQLLGFPHQNDDDSNMLGLFILNPSFFAVPGSTVLLRVFEPRYLILVRRCIETGTCFGLQAGATSRRGLLIVIKRYRELPEGHIILEGLAVARYEAFDNTCQLEEDDTFGLYRMKSKMLVDHDVSSAQEREMILQLNRRAEYLIQARFNEMSRYEKEVITTISGVRPSVMSYESYSFWLLGALYSPDPNKADVLFHSSALYRIRFCLKLLQEEPHPFECLMDEASPQ